MKIEMVFIDYGIRRCKKNKYRWGENYLIYQYYKIINKDVIKHHRQRCRYQKYWILDD